MIQLLPIMELLCDVSSFFFTKLQALGSKVLLMLSYFCATRLIAQRLNFSTSRSLRPSTLLPSLPPVNWLRSTVRMRLTRVHPSARGWVGRGAPICTASNSLWKLCTSSLPWNLLAQIWRLGHTKLIFCFWSSNLLKNDQATRLFILFFIFWK